MGRMNGLWFMMLFVSSSRSAPVSQNFAVQSGSSVSVQRGQTATLPCWLSPPQSAEDLEVRWYRSSDQFDAPIMLYKEKQLHGSQKDSYAGRVSFGLKDAASSGLKSGDVSLDVVNVTIQDAGDYTCFVSSSQDYGSSTVSLHVTETGGPPLLSAVWKEDNMVEVSCESEGWFPHPELHWSDKNKALTTDNLKYGNSSTGLLSVHSQVLVSDSSEVSCSVGFTNIVIKESRMRLESPQRSQQGGSGSSSAAWVAFGILLLIVLAGAGALFFKKRLKKRKSGGDQPDGLNLSNDSEEKGLLSTEMETPSALSEASKHYVNVQLVNTDNPLIKIKDSILRDTLDKDRVTDGDRVTCLTAVRGSPGFSSGQHYWEVSLRRDNLALKQSWWIGVTNQPEVPQEVSFSPNTSNGFWFLASSPDQSDVVQFSSESKVFLPVQSKPATVGVYLNYETGEISFYNVEDKRLIGSFEAKFTGEVFPFFNPGKGDVSPMEILQKTEQVESNDHENSNSVAEEGKLV